MIDERDIVITHMVLSCNFAHWFGVSPKSAETLAALYLTPKAITVATLATCTASADATVMRVYMPTLRQALVDDALDNLPGQGYILTPQGRAECKAALTRIRAELRSAT